MIAMKTISYQLIYARFRGLGFNMSVIQLYAPTADCNGNDIEELYDNLQQQLDEVDKNNMLLLMGDWNAKVRTNRETWHGTIGRHGYGDMNERGERLLEFCSENQLCITNTYFQHKPSRKWTWSHPNGRSKNMIDFIITNKR